MKRRRGGEEGRQDREMGEGERREGKGGREGGGRVHRREKNDYGGGWSYAYFQGFSRPFQIQ
jgi:hypothetical protein